MNKLKNLKKKATKKMISANLMRILKKTKNWKKKHFLKINRNKRMNVQRKMNLENLEKNLRRNSPKLKMIKNLMMTMILVILEKPLKNQKLKINQWMKILVISVKLQKVKSKKILVNSTKPLWHPLQKKKSSEILMSLYKLQKILRRHLHQFKWTRNKTKN